LNGRKREGKMVLFALNAMLSIASTSPGGQRSINKVLPEERRQVEVEKTLGSNSQAH
jgi:hypothetical protein